MWLPVTSLYAALCTVLYLGLAARVSQLRRSEGVGLGSGDRPDLQRAIRAHGNAAEFLPLALLLLALMEIQQFPAAWLYPIGAGIFLGRLLHAAGLNVSAGYSFGRFFGSLVTWGLLVGMGGALIWRSLAGLPT